MFFIKKKQKTLMKLGVFQTTKTLVLHRPQKSWKGYNFREGGRWYFYSTISKPPISETWSLNFSGKKLLRLTAQWVKFYNFKPMINKVSTNLLTISFMKSADFWKSSLIFPIKKVFAEHLNGENFLIMKYCEQSIKKFP